MMHFAEFLLGAVIILVIIAAINLVYTFVQAGISIWLFAIPLGIGICWVVGHCFFKLVDHK